MTEKWDRKTKGLYMIAFVLVLSLNFMFGMVQTEETQQAKIKRLYKRC